MPARKRDDSTCCLISYLQVLARRGGAHVYNHWSHMPPLADQHTRMDSFTAPFTVLRLLTPSKLSYEAAKKRAEPYTKIVEELPQMRREAVQLVRQAVSEGRRAYVLGNNRSEGNAPLTVQALTEDATRVDLRAVAGHPRADE